MVGTIAALLPVCEVMGWSALCGGVGIIVGASLVLLVESVMYPDSFRLTWGRHSKTKKSAPRAVTPLSKYCAKTAYCVDPDGDASWMPRIALPAAEAVGERGERTEC